MNDPFDDTPAALPEKPQPLKTHKTKKAYKKLALTMALAASIVGILPASFTAPTIAQALRKNPIIGSVFTLLGDSGLKTADNKGFISDIKQIETDEGLTLKITEALYDGSRLSIGYVVQSTQELNDNTNPQVEFKIDGKRLGTYGAGGHNDFIDKHTYVGVLHVDPADNLPTSFDLDMKFRQLGDVEGRWNFSFPITEQSADNKTVILMQIKKFEDTTIEIDKITFATTSTEVVGAIYQPKDSAPLEFELEDDQGTKLPRMNGSRQEDSFRVLFDPVQQIPKSITIRAIGTGLEMTIPIE